MYQRTLYYLGICMTRDGHRVWRLFMSPCVVRLSGSTYCSGILWILVGWVPGSQGGRKNMEEHGRATQAQRISTKPERFGTRLWMRGLWMPRKQLAEQKRQHKSCLRVTNSIEYMSNLSRFYRMLHSSILMNKVRANVGMKPHICKGHIHELLSLASHQGYSMVD
jgi:hypothetical protein